jgi:hypothetical protein
MKVVFVVLTFGVMGCAAQATEEAGAREDIQPAIETPTPSAPAKEASPSPTPPKRATPGAFEKDPISGVNISNGLPGSPPNCTETVFEESCATSHEYLAKALDLCFTTKGDLSEFRAEGTCTDKPGYKKAKVTCCYGMIVSEKPAALPVVAPSTIGSGMGGGSARSDCPGVTLSGSAYAVQMATQCAKGNLELTSVYVSDRCADGTARTVGESCGALMSFPK